MYVFYKTETSSSLLQGKSKYKFPQSRFWYNIRRIIVLIYKYLSSLKQFQPVSKQYNHFKLVQTFE